MEYEFDDDPARIDRDAVWRWLSTEAYWARWRTRADVEAQLDSAWRLVAAYRRDTGELVGFARAISDGVAFGYLADVFVVEEHRGRGISKGLVSLMIDEGPGPHFRWTLFTSDAHGLYRRFGFTEPDRTALVRPASSV
ncbi:Acetyltransferase (GNAT) domain-containing protein [Microbacterium hydrothermale]|uniref:GNAT family N-acetyltransferase n=1 Tax=Microbacterium hydrothermale TaxID=857427 RepID=UPI00222622E2|nr:GNAT family N-acetyltransferase [Microbacterium hydrothermale]MCW2164146.1 Acetyltransferase (GNAT) domain-containing protein [Microbacterium hydrothermale]